MPDEKTGRLDEELVVQMKGITKVYPNGVAANQGVDFTLRKGEIHALMGENGAGKSTNTSWRRSRTNSKRIPCSASLT